MTTIADWAADALLASFFLALLVLAIRTPVARLFGPRVAYALWALPALRLVLPPIPALMLPWSQATAPATSAASVFEPVIIESVVTAATSPPLTQQWTDALWHWEPAALLALWLGGAAVHLTRQLLAHRRLLNQLRDAEIERWAAHVRIVNSRHVGGPLSLGLLTPMVVMPDDASLALNQQERALAIRHELMHHQRGDLWANAAAVLFAALHWFNPLIGTMWRAFRFDQEAACDADVLAGADGPTRGTYARALAKAASGRPSAFASNMMHANNLKERLAMMTLPPRSARRRNTGLTITAALTVGLLLATATPRLAVAQESPPTPPAPPPTGDPMAVDATAAEGQHVVHIERGNGTTIILHTDHPLNAEELATATAEAEQAIAQSVPVEGDHAGDGQHTRRTIVVRTRHGEGPATHVETSNITRRSIVIVDAANAEDRADAADAAADAADAADAEEGHRRVLLLNSGGIANGFAAARCRDGAAPNNVVNEAAGDEHSRSRVVIMQCGQGASAEHRLAALRRARQSLAQGNMESSVAAVAGAAAGREAVARALANLDRQIAELEAQN